EVVTEELLELEQPGRAKLARSCPAAALRLTAVGTYGVLHRPHREPLADDASRELLLERAVRGAQQRARVAALERVLLDQLLDRGWELQEPQRVRDRDAAASDARRHLIVSEVEVLDELLVRGCFLERVEVGAMDVLDQSVLEGRRVVGGTDQRRDRLQARPSRRPPPPFTGDELVAFVGGAHEHRLEHADLADRIGQRAELLPPEVPRWLGPGGPDRRAGRLVVPAGAEAFRRAGGDQGAESLTQTAFSRHDTPLSQAPGTPWRPGRWNRTR